MTNKYILLTGIIALLVSCSRSLTDLGYSSRAINTNVHTENNFYRYSQTAVPDMHNPGPGYVTRDKSYATYNIIADEDLENLFLVSVKVRMAALQKFYSDLKTGTFSKARLNNEKSVRKNIKRKKEDILLTFKPSHGNDSFEKYSLLENIKIIEED